jgi:putative FmdB family regulatory protein
MPLYEYQCEACGGRFEVIQQKYSDAPADTCRVCGGGPVRRLISSPAIQFKGTGWYITDYSQKGKPPAESSGGEKAESSGGEKKDGSGSKDADSKKDKDTKPASSDASSTSTADKSAAPAASSTSKPGTGT